MSDRPRRVSRLAPPTIPSSSTTDIAPAFETASQFLSTARMETYRRACASEQEAVALYGWNARVSGVLLIPAHFAEVVVRNAIADVLVEVYGDRWPWSTDFVRSLPAPSPGAYSPRADLQMTARRMATTGKVVADLKLAFWEHLLTRRHHGRLWRGRIQRVFPGAGGVTEGDLRVRLFEDLRALRRLRNRIAHHEPVIAYDLQAELDRMLRLVEGRSPGLALWVAQLDLARMVIAERPQPDP